MTIRDPRLPKEHFQEFISVGGELEERRQVRLFDGRTGRSAYGQHSQIIDNLLEATLAGYLMGKTLEEVQTRFFRAVDHLRQACLPRQDPGLYS